MGCIKFLVIGMKLYTKRFALLHLRRYWINTNWRFSLFNIITICVIILISIVYFILITLGLLFQEFELSKHSIYGIKLLMAGIKEFSDLSYRSFVVGYIYWHLFNFIKVLISNFPSDVAHYALWILLYEGTSIWEINCGYCIEISGKFNVFLSEDISACYRCRVSNAESFQRTRGCARRICNRIGEGKKVKLNFFTQHEC